jgi:hypothetical protein
MQVCSTWKEPDLTDDMTEAKRHLERWLFYFDRFNNHELSTALDVELLGRSAERITRVQEETGLSWIEAQYMREAVEELSRCRQTLKWTYAMAHFLENGNDKEIFEANQMWVRSSAFWRWSAHTPAEISRLRSSSFRSCFRKRSQPIRSRSCSKRRSTGWYVSSCFSSFRRSESRPCRCTSDSGTTSSWTTRQDAWLRAPGSGPSLSNDFLTSLLPISIPWSLAWSHAHKVIVFNTT